MNIKHSKVSDDLKLLSQLFIAKLLTIHLEY